MTKEKQKSFGKLILMNPEHHCNLPSEFELQNSFTSIGRNQTADLKIDSMIFPQMISRNHAQILHDFDSNITKIFDIRSLNGTFINNIKVSHAELKCGDIIHFGGNKLKEGGAFTKLEGTEDIPTELNKNFGKNIIIYKFEKENDRNLLKRQRESQLEEKDLKIQKTETLERKSMIPPTINIITNSTIKPNQTEKKNEISVSSSNIILDSKFKELCSKFECEICKQLIHKATAIQPCSHTFCQECIYNSLKQKKKCPICNKGVTAKPNRNIIIDNVVETIVKQLPEVYFEERNVKIEKQKKIEEESLKKLSNLVETAKKGKQQFLDIQKPWSSKNRETFQKGLMKFTGKARIQYCQLTGFTQSWIKQANYNQLIKACNNIGISIPENSKGQKTQNADEIKEKLETFLENLLF
eukprot:gene5685-9506_t